MDASYCSKEIVDLIHNAGKKVSIFWCYMKDTEEQMEYIVSLGIDSVVTDHPLRWMNFLKTKMAEVPGKARL